MSVSQSLSDYVAGGVGSILSGSPGGKSKSKKVKSSKLPLVDLFDGATTQGGCFVSKPQKSRVVLETGQIGDPQEDDRHPVATIGETDQHGDSTVDDGAMPSRKSRKAKASIPDDDDDSDEEAVKSRVAHPARRRKKDFKTDPERNRRTLFIGNLPLDFKKKQLLRLCAEFGPVSSVRFRSVSVADGSKSRKLSVWKKEYNSGRQGQNAYVVFCEEEAARRGLALHNRVVEERHLNVDIASNEGQRDYRCSVFVGNLPRDIQEETVRYYFDKECGAVDRVRLIRDSTTGEGKGFGYVWFAERETVLLALKCHGESLEGRTLRVFRARKPSEEQKGQRKHGDGKKSTSGVQAAKGDVPKAFRNRSQHSSTPHKKAGKGAKKPKGPKGKWQSRKGKPSPMKYGKGKKGPK